MTLDDYILHLQHLDPFHPEAFLILTQDHVNQPPPGPLMLGRQGSAQYAVRSQRCPFDLADAKQIDLRGDLTLRQDLIRFFPELRVSEGNANADPRRERPPLDIGVYLGALLCVDEPGHPSNRDANGRTPADTQHWQDFVDTSYHLIVSVRDASIWLIYQYTSAPIKKGLQVKGLEGSFNTMRLFGGVPALIEALKQHKESELFTHEVIQTATLMYFRPWVVRQEDLQAIGLSTTSKKTMTTVDAPLAVVKSQDEIRPAASPTRSGWLRGILGRR